MTDSSRIVLHNADPAALVTQIEELLMAAGEGDAAGIGRLNTFLRRIEPHDLTHWPAALRGACESGVELVLEAMDRRHLRDADVDLLHTLAAAGFDRPLLRDLFAAAARSRFGTYADPAGLLKAIGVHDPAIGVTTLLRRWEMIAALEPGTCGVHPVHGTGEVQQLDGISNEVIVRFARNLRLPLDVALGSLTIVRRGSPLDRWRRGQARLDPATITAAELRAALQASVLPPPADPVALLTALLVPALLTAERLDTILAARAAAAADAESAAALPTEPVRPWGEARNTTELLELLRPLSPPLSATEAGRANLTALWRAAAPREDQSEVLAETVAHLWRLAAATDWLSPIIQGVGPLAICWQRPDLFVRISDRMAGKLVGHWFTASAVAVGLDRLVELVMDLPLRLWPVAERLVVERDGNPQRLVDAAVLRVGVGAASADLLLWLWRTEVPERDVVADTTVIFRTLAKPVRGAFIKAAKDLRKSLFDSQDFQRFIMHDGDPTAVTDLVRCVRQMPLLDAGEQQSLLVRIVRLFPEAKPLVEQRHATVTRKPVDKVTSMRSFELRRRELTLIINVRIPANSRAIAHARGYGDLRENAEYKAAKDEQRLLSARRRDLERGLDDVRAVDFAIVQVTDRVIPGSTAVVQAADGRREEYHVLGLWDSVPERRMLSYDTPLGRVLLGRQVGDAVDLPSGEKAQVAEIRALSEDLLTWLRGDDLETA